MALARTHNRHELWGLRCTAGFGLATQGVGSAVVLNGIFWLALVISIPLRGFHLLYAIAAVAGVLLIGAFAGTVLLITRGQTRAMVVVEALARHMPLVNPETVSSLLQKLADRVHILLADRALLRHAILWAALNWLLDASCLWVCLLAFHHYLNPIDLFVAYGVGNVLAAIPLTPGGLGTVEVAVGALLRGFGVPTLIAAFAVLGWRLFNFWLPIPAGGGCYLSLRVERGATLREMATNARRSRGGGGGKPASKAKNTRRSHGDEGTDSGPSGVVPPIS